MKYYPIGTVVTLVNGDRPIMIYGRKQFQENTDNIWDYVACLYPEEISVMIIQYSFNRKKSERYTIWV